MVTKKSIIDAYIFLRENNNIIPDETLEFMKEAAFKELRELEYERHKTVRNSYNDFIGTKIQYVIDPYQFDSEREALRYRLEYYIRKELDYYNGLVCDFDHIKTEISAGMIIVSGTVTVCELNGG